MFDYTISFFRHMHAHPHLLSQLTQTHASTHTYTHTHTLCPSMWNLNSGRLISVLPAVLLPETLELKCNLTKWQEIKWDHMKKIAILTHFTHSFLCTHTDTWTYTTLFFLMMHSVFASRHPFHLFSTGNNLSVPLSFSIQLQLSKQSWSSRLLTIYPSLVFRFHLGQLVFLLPCCDWVGERMANWLDSCINYTIVRQHYSVFCII